MDKHIKHKFNDRLTFCGIKSNETNDSYWITKEVTCDKCKERVRDSNLAIIKSLNLNMEILSMLIDTWNECDENDKSTEYMFARMSEIIDHDEVVDFIMNYVREF